VQRTRNRGDVGGHQWDMRLGTTSQRCAPWASSSGEKENEGDDIRVTRIRSSDAPTRKEMREGGSGTGTRAKKLRANKCAGERGVYSARGRGECGATPWPHEHDSRGPRH
jgi:hypothetical protein